VIGAATSDLSSTMINLTNVYASLACIADGFSQLFAFVWAEKQTEKILTRSSRIYKRLDQKGMGGAQIYTERSRVARHVTSPSVYLQNRFSNLVFTLEIILIKSSNNGSNLTFRYKCPSFGHFPAFRCVFLRAVHSIRIYVDMSVVSE
jgi:hypothetical protein